MKRNAREIRGSIRPGASAISLVFLAIVSFILLLMIVMFLARAFASLVGLAS